MRCKCGNDKFYAHQLVRLDVIVDEDGTFDRNMYDNAEAAIYDAEKPYGPVTIYLPHVRGSQPPARDISLPKLYNGEAVVWRYGPRAFRSCVSQPACLPVVQDSICAGRAPKWSLVSANR